MRRQEVVSAFDDIEQAVRYSGIYAAIRSHRQEPSSPGRHAQLIESAFRLRASLERLSPEASRLANALRLTAIAPVAYLTRAARLKLLDAEERLRHDQETEEVLRTIEFVLRSFDIVGEFLSNEAISLSRNGSGPKMPDSQADAKVLTIVLPETSGSVTTSIGRLATALSALQVLSELLQRIVVLESPELAEFENEGMVVLSLDSGSDKSVDLLGLAATVKEVREFAFGIWDRYVERGRPTSQDDLERVAKALPVFERISALVEAGAVSPEEAVKLRRKAMEGALGVISSGCAPLDYVNQPSIQPRSFVAPVRIAIEGPVVVPDGSGDPT